jgi:hypothetical protein
MSKDTSTRGQQMRELIAQHAARLIAEDGVPDFAQAKRKAAHRLGAPDTRNLPTNAEVEEALRVFRSLFQKEEHEAVLRALRMEALRAMRLLAPFNPYLTGSVLTGTAGRHSDINLLLYPDSPKDVEMFLLNRQIPYRCGERRMSLADTPNVVPVFTLTGDGADINAAVLSHRDERTAVRPPLGHSGPGRISASGLEELLSRPAL